MCTYASEIKFVDVAQVVGLAVLFALGEEQPTVKTCKEVPNISIGTNSIETNYLN